MGHRVLRVIEGAPRRGGQTALSTESLSARLVTRDMIFYHYVKLKVKLQAKVEIPCWRDTKGAIQILSLPVRVGMALAGVLMGGLATVL